jgi:hypothetical protein
MTKYEIEENTGRELRITHVNLTASLKSPKQNRYPADRT